MIFIFILFSFFGINTWKNRIPSNVNNFGLKFHYLNAPHKSYGINSILTMLIKMFGKVIILETKSGKIKISKVGNHSEPEFKNKVYEVLIEFSKKYSEKILSEVKISIKILKKNLKISIKTLNRGNVIIQIFSKDKEILNAYFNQDEIINMKKNDLKIPEEKIKDIYDLIPYILEKINSKLIESKNKSQ
jgi:hypothetical protein